MSFYLKLDLPHDLSKENEEKIINLGWKLNLDPYESTTKQKDRRETRENYVNLVSVHRHHCRYPEVQIGLPDTHDSEGFPVPINPENMEIIKEICSLALGGPLFSKKVK